MQRAHYKAHIVLGGRDVDTVLVLVYLFRGPCVSSLHWGHSVCHSRTRYSQGTSVSENTPQ